ncbi:MAG: hypothetical protein WBI14_03285 [Anaerolineaceae bacterium]
MKHSRRYGLLIFCLIIITLGCRYTAPTPVAWRGTETAVVQGRTASAQALTPSPTVTSTPTATAAPTRVSTPIPSDGPWLLFPSEDGSILFTADRDTNLVRQLDLPSPVIVADLPGAVSPDGKILLVRAGSTQNEGEFALYKVSGTNLAVQNLTSLLSGGVQKDLLNVNNRQAGYALQAAIAPYGISWNQIDGRAVFPKAVDGDATNLFSYNPATQKIDRITSRYQQDLIPLWSPGGQILVFQEADTRNNPYQWRVSLVASMSMDNLERVNYLYSPPQDSIEEVYVGWLNESRLLMFTHSEMGNSKLRLLNVNGGTPISLFAGNFDSVTISPTDGSIALLIGDESARQNKQAPGIYLRSTGTITFDQVLLGSYLWLEFDSGLGSFLASNDSGVVAFDKNGTHLSIPDASGLNASPDGQWLISWSDTGTKLHAADGTFLQQISSDSVENLIWQKDSLGFYLLQADGLYHSQFPRLDPIKLTEDVYHQNGGLFSWLGSD